MPLIAFLGCDGAGKSAVIEGVKRYLEEQGHEVALGHWRPRPFQGEASEEEVLAAADPHGKKKRGALLSVVKLGWVWLNWWVGWFSGLRGQCKAGFVLYDRFHGDMIVDPTRYRYGGPMGLVRLASACMPQPHRVIFLDAEVDVLLQRKQEVSAEALERSRRGYQSLCRTGGAYRVIDAGRPLPEVIDTVLKAINHEHKTRP